MSYPPVVVVNSDDKVIGWSPTAEAWERGLIHRIVLVVVEDSRGRLLLHKRAPGMKISPGRWDTVGGHVDVTPDYEQSARLELQEEMGIEDVELEEVAYFYCEEPYDNGVHAKRFIKLFWARDDAGSGKLSADEVVATKWFSRDELRQLVADHPELVAEGLMRCLPYIIGAYADYSHQTASQADRPLFGLR